MNRILKILFGPAQNLAQRFARAREGVSAVEFALLAPVMICLYFGMTELSQAFMAQRRVEHTASAIADLVAQSQSVDTNALNEIFTVGKLVMSPFSTTPMTQRITSVTASSTGVPKVDWSVANGGAVALTAGSTVTLPANLIAANESVIMSDVTYDYTSVGNYILNMTLHFKQTYYLRPRIVDKVAKT